MLLTLGYEVTGDDHGGQNRSLELAVRFGIAFFSTTTYLDETTNQERRNLKPDS
ncbi:hypothetical protein [Luteolibacter arcticus]|uniref:hypothetical protein n=1 Tax=Luteolibacter arcticus TaxID=1581411 RepID=UPI002221B4B6|nr:hypothetical protein [Luteolibacter arcticus]